jgi:DNA-binding MarR family transcriptional regulator
LRFGKRSHAPAAELDVDQGALSDLLGRLSRAGLVNIEPEYWRTLNGVLLAPRGESLLEETREIVRTELRELLSLVDRSPLQVRR